MSNELVKQETTSIAAANRSMPSGKEMAEFVETAKMLAMCPYYQKLGPHGILAIWLTAREMNLPPMMCLNGGMYTFSGLVTLSGGMMNMMLVNAGHRVNVLHLDTSRCRIQFWRCDRPAGQNTFEYEYTIDDARNAGLTNKDNWKKNTRDMLFNRCLSGGARKFMPDAIMGAYALGEVPGDDAVSDSIPATISIPMCETKVMPTVEYITAEQVAEIEAIKKECDPKRIEKIDAWLKQKCGGQDISKLKAECFKNTIEKLLDAKADYLAKKINAVMSGEEEEQNAG
jgi:hypothetical protein